ncbi:hypothetical protein [Streptomyces sp. RKAG293]|uniref:hypothetical protein n=1 Tax=Streptomyces sp. RKAG293 TaxID=2893403 RepID=UPI0020333767|nr:hypothetical protein [Streptomyces sp. RKAG293]MCM2424295.1 hypothetical protein [Streptomyces sp. RKAG293]
MSDDTSMMRPVLCEQHHTFSCDVGQGQVCWELVPNGFQAQLLFLIDQRIRQREADDPGERPRTTRRSSVAFVAMWLGVEPRVVRRHARGWVFAWPGRELRGRVYERVLDTVCPYRLAESEAELAEQMAKEARREARQAARRRSRTDT